MSDIENAIKRWWEHDMPAIKAELFKQFRVGALEEPVARMMLRAMRAAFIAGWNARDRQDVQQGDLFGGRDE